MSLATMALGTFTSQRYDFEVSMSSLRRIHSLITVALDKIISGYSIEVLSDLAQAYVITEYQYRRDVLEKPCLAGLIEELLNTLSVKLRQKDPNLKAYARRARLVIDSALVAAKRR
jgi:CRISPR/Cas system CSM-associated protein Csm2 small subunit